jgi:hypothetical protein
MSEFPRTVSVDEIRAGDRIRCTRNYEAQAYIVIEEFTVARMHEKTVETKSSSGSAAVHTLYHTGPGLIVTYELLSRLPAFEQW